MRYLFFYFRVDNNLISCFLLYRLRGCQQLWSGITGGDSLEVKKQKGELERQLKFFAMSDHDVLRAIVPFGYDRLDQLSAYEV